MEFSVTERGARKLLWNGYEYVKQKDLANDLTSWKCVERRKGYCKAKVKWTVLDVFVDEVNGHSHAPSQTKCELTKVRANIKRKAETTQDTTQQILTVELQNITPAAAVNLPPLSSMRRNIRLQRQDRNVLPNPLRREDIPVLPQQYQLTAAGGQFLIFDSGVGDVNRMFIFATHEALDLLANSPQWFADGTFKICPEIFFQIYSIHAQSNNEVIPCVFGLLPNKNEITYIQFLTEVRNAVRNIYNNPVRMLVDFERAVINGIGNVMPQVQVFGCFFHLCSNIWKHIQSAGLQEQYVGDAQFALRLRMIAAVAFVPPHDVIDAFDEVADLIRLQYQAVADDVLEYFEDTYIGRFRRNAPRRPPLFPIDLWNMFNRTDEELPRTNNSIEGWHRGFQSNVSSCHPTFWKFLEVLQK